MTNFLSTGRNSWKIGANHSGKRAPQGQSATEESTASRPEQGGHKPSLTEQLKALKTILHDHTSPLQMEKELGNSSFIAAKKDNNKLKLSTSLLPPPLNDLTKLMCFALDAARRLQPPGSQGSPVQMKLG